MWNIHKLNQCVRDLCVPCSVLHMFYHHGQTAVNAVTNCGYFDYGKTPKTPTLSRMLGFFWDLVYIWCLSVLKNAEKF